MDRFNMEATTGSLNLTEAIYLDCLEVDDHGRFLITLKVKLHCDTVIALGV